MATSTQNPDGSFTLAAPGVVTKTTPLAFQASTGQTSTNQPPALPTAVVSSLPAQTQVADIKNTVTQTQAQIDVQNQTRVSNQNKPGYDVFGNPVVGTPLPGGGAAAPVAQTPEEKIASQPSDGMKFVYDANGNEQQIPIDQPVPDQYTTVNPRQEPTIPVTATAQTNLYLYKQYQDGSYGRYSLDQNGNYTYAGSATQVDFQGAQAQQAGTQALNTIMNGGTLPLTDNQKAQIAGLQTTWQDAIAKQQLVNANAAGAQGIFQMLHGGEGQIDTVGIIADTVQKGVTIIADLNSKMLSAIALMESGFQTDDYNLIKSAYDTYNQNESAKNKQISDMQDKVAQAVKDAQAVVDKQNAAKAAVVAQDKQIAATRQDQADNDIRSLLADMEKGNATPEQLAAVQKALTNHDYAAAVQAAGNSTLDPTTPAGEYSAYVKTQTAAGKPVMVAGDFIAAQKYKEAYALASATAAVQAGQEDKAQAKLQKQLQTAALSSRSDLGIQSRKVSAAIAAQVLLNQYTDKNGKFDVPASQYGELLLSVANLLSPTGVASVTTQEGLRQATASGDFNNMITYATGHPMAGAPQDIIQNLATTVKNEGLNAEISRNKSLDAQSVGLDPTRKDSVINALPSYDKMSQGDISYQTPEQINTNAVTQVADFRTDPTNAAANEKAYQTVKTQYPNASPTDIAQILGLIPLAK